MADIPEIYQLLKEIVVDFSVSLLVLWSHTHLLSS